MTGSPTNRVEFDEDGQLDEIVTDGGAHLEDMGKDRWFLCCRRADGSEAHVWIKGKVTSYEELPPPESGEGAQ